MSNFVLSVSQLNAYVHGLLGRDPVLRSICVEGEISGFKRHGSGHLYFSLKDAGAVVRCVMFRSDAGALQFVPKDGLQVRLVAEASLYERDGQFQLYVRSMQQRGEGDLYRRFLMLKAKLEAKGFFAVERKRPIPLLPGCVGVVTSGTGAALQDILQIIRRRYPKMDIEICPVSVQGEGASHEIASAIRYMNAHSHASVLIVGRGGGSLEDLWAFNEECVAQAIYESNIPVISAVGHETDYTIADFTADLRAPTPSAAAELCVPEYAALVQNLDDSMQRLILAFSHSISQKKDRVQRLLQARGFPAAEYALMQKRQRLQTDLQNMRHIMADTLQESRLRAENGLLRLQALSPIQLLDRGFAMVSDEQGNRISSVSQLKTDMKVMIRMQDGTAKATIDGVNKPGKSDNRRKKHAEQKDI